MAGEVSDRGSGVAGVEISLDGGRSWQALYVVNERWRYNWDTTRQADGRKQVIDIAGNLQSPGAMLTVLTANRTPIRDLCVAGVCLR